MCAHKCISVKHFTRSPSFSVHLLLLFILFRSRRKKWNDSHAHKISKPTEIIKWLLFILWQKKKNCLVLDRFISIAIAVIIAIDHTFCIVERWHNAFPDACSSHVAAPLIAGCFLSLCTELSFLRSTMTRANEPKRIKYVWLVSLISWNLGPCCCCRFFYAS